MANNSTMNSKNRADLLRQVAAAYHRAAEFEKLYAGSRNPHLCGGLTSILAGVLQMDCDELMERIRNINEAKGQKP